MKVENCRMNDSVMIENMINWAKEKIGNSQYAGWCLAFIEDALEISNHIEIFGGACIILEKDGNLISFLV